ncbi:hypothetical protein Nepgr_003586 [Nepenthes gracilis]|uniref:Uncharacterized protein n=1 Tax=Nepenthes gracilis TaxID=150966 RepID=A0AAD3RZV1_NEPGR|nr:hypothetical protein Nepgr_003586 [Nepenthes gracilis]
MDGARAASTIKTVHNLTSATTARITGASNMAKSAPPCKKAETLLATVKGRSFSIGLPSQQRGCTSPPTPKNGSLLLTRCSTKPGVDSDNVTSKNPPITLDPNSTAQQSSAPAQRRALSSMSCRGLVLDLGPECSWDGSEIGSPVVKRYIGDDEERWYMWYYGRLSRENASDSIGLAVSGNGICWARGAGPARSSSDVGMVMNCSVNWWGFDTESIRPSEMVIMSSNMYSSVYWLYYTGCTAEEVKLPELPKLPIENPERAHSDAKKSEHHEIGKVLKSLPGLACSQDGRNWARIEGDHHNGALLDVGSGKEWDSLFIAAPRVVMHCGDDIRMYYHSYDLESKQFAIGMARSRDGIRWVKLGKILGGRGNGYFDELGVMNAHVVRDQKYGKYLMAYEGVAADGMRSIGMAISEDGLKNWVRIQDDPVLWPSGNYGWDNRGVGSPYLVHMEGSADEWRLYYRGLGQEGRTGIGMAVSNGSAVRRFHRWEGFHL